MSAETDNGLATLARAATLGDGAAFAQLQRRAEAGEAHALYLIGLMHDGTGHEGIPGDRVLARQYFERAVALGHGSAAYSLANMYDTGEGGVQNDTGARQLYGVMAEAGMRDAQLHFARFLETGRGGAKDIDGAVRWYKAAVDQGVELAATNLALMHLRSQVADPDLDLAKRLLMFAANRLDGLAHMVLAEMLVRGKGVEPNLNLSVLHNAIAELLLTDPELQREAHERKEQVLAMHPPARDAVESDARKFVADRKRDEMSGAQPDSR